MSAERGSVVVKQTVEEQLSEMIPKSIDDIFRKNRDKGGIRFSTNEDLAEIASQIKPGRTRAVPISRWNLVTVWQQCAPQFVVLFGRNDDEGRTWNTSPVVRHDANARLLVTQSGNLYALAGPQGGEEGLDLLHLCIYLRQPGAGDFYGIPAFFY